MLPGSTDLIKQVTNLNLGLSDTLVLTGSGGALRAWQAGKGAWGGPLCPVLTAVTVPSTTEHVLHLCYFQSSTLSVLAKVRKHPWGRSHTARLFSSVKCLITKIQIRDVQTFPSVSYSLVAAVTVHSDFGAQENKVCHCFHFFSSICQEVMEPGTMILVF